jgi:predicted ATP-dependent endonuclease of OLD family
MINIKRLRMESFRGFRELTLDFDSQLNILIGDNGSGKSSILDCLSSFLDYLASQIKGEHLSYALSINTQSD